MPKDNKTMRKNQSQRNDSSSAHYERSNENPNMQNIPEAPGVSDYSDLLKESIGADNPELFEARLKSFLSGVPYVGPFVQAYDQSQMLEDLYKRTGKVPAYPGYSSIGYGGLGNAVGNTGRAVANRIADGSHDLYQYYAGEPDNFRKMMNGAYL